MRGEVQFTAPEVARTIGTRIALGVGLGLLIANRLSEDQRRAVGWTLLLAGAFSAANMVAELFGRPRTMTLAFGPGLRSEAAERPDQPAAFART